MSDATTTRQDAMRWQEEATRKRRSLPAGLLPRLALGLSGAALAGLNVLLYLEDGALRAP
ncbi:hypothetical protein [Parvibaculum sp.]|uniref:hypothetical protein n=1 Tax=Parvibaculum sp. TaxID=2024848 RepID=UPI001B13B6F6|nr:hypothetical protein [Parvibaculum sp.]MBO6635060.1 hypothetical protein [Parvibaculum sp.]MBO6678688.1 hypothetical protein [Parvibaculum sp.]MBO6683952.1 hypothetical protein [Parvibaculum sp.]MBO6905291.1 hypothetical protein [Parvibaculum sp.]